MGPGLDYVFLICIPSLALSVCVGVLVLLLLTADSSPSPEGEGWGGGSSSFIDGDVCQVCEKWARMSALPAYPACSSALPYLSHF